MRCFNRDRRGYWAATGNINLSLLKLEARGSRLLCRPLNFQKSHFFHSDCGPVDETDRRARQLQRMERIAESEWLRLGGRDLWFHPSPELHLTLFQQHITRWDLVNNFFGRKKRLRTRGKQQT